MADDAEKLWREAIDALDPPLVAIDLKGPFFCFFCGAHSPTDRKSNHESDCIWVRAKTLLGRPREFRALRPPRVGTFAYQAALKLRAQAAKTSEPSCPTCRGAQSCPLCQGEGTISPMFGHFDCPYCKGSGWCPTCSPRTADEQGDSAKRKEK